MKGDGWKFQLINDIDTAMTQAGSRGGILRPPRFCRVCGQLDGYTQIYYLYLPERTQSPGQQITRQQIYQGEFRV